MRKLSISAFAVVLVLTPIGASAQPRQANLPDGVGKDLVEGLCTGCHSANQIVRSSGYTEEEWAEHFSTMVDLADMPKERSEIARYLAANMPPDTTRAPTLVPSELEVGFTEWKVPALGQRARGHDLSGSGELVTRRRIGRTVLVLAVTARTGDVTVPHVVEPETGIGLVAGDMLLSGAEDELSSQWPDCLDRKQRAFRVLSALWRALRMAADEMKAELILVDVGPHLGALNRAALITTDHVVVPLAPDLQLHSGALQSRTDVAPMAAGVVGPSAMQEFPRWELERIAARPSLDSWLQGVRRRKDAAGTRLRPANIVRARDADRR